MGHRHSAASASATPTTGATSKREKDVEEADYEVIEFNLGLPGRGRGRLRKLRLGNLTGHGQRSSPSRAAALLGGFGLSLCRGLLSVPRHGLRVAGVCVSYTSAAALCAFFPGASKVLGLLSILSRRRVLGLASPPPFTQRLMRPLRPLSGAFLTYGCLWAVLPLAAPSVWRSLMYWQRGVPVITSYVVTALRAKRARRMLQQRSDAAPCTPVRAIADPELLWQRQHEAAADRLFEILCDLKGFYLKLGQILATKTDMLPPPYTASLSRLLDKMPATPFAKVQKSIEKELGGKLSSFFACVDPYPLASATVAQVHQARLVSGADVVLKLQHIGTKRMMASDLHNLRLCCTVMDALKIRLGFDLTSVVREYCDQVPLEFNFEREAAMAELIRETLLEHSQHFPLLRQVVVPEMLLFLSTPRLLTMQHMDGVPILDIAGMDVEIKTQLMAALVLAYGVMILRAGVFHSDPHPGNLLACCHSSLSLLQPDIRVAILDFGQVKRLCDESRLRYALLVCALACRDEELLVATMREMGLVVENCSQEFEAIAGYILFDTRMDFPEAHQSPLDPQANEGWRTAKVPSLPQDLFMIVRVITLLRGVMHSLGVDISSAVMWRPLALQTIAELSSRNQGKGWVAAETLSRLTSAGPERNGGRSPADGMESHQQDAQVWAQQRAALAATAGQGMASGGSSGPVTPRWAWSPGRQGSAVAQGRADGRRSASPQAVAAAELAEFLASQQAVPMEQQRMLQTVQLL